MASLGFPEGAPPIRVSDNEALNLLLRRDTGWYLNIAMEGYQWSAETEGQQNIAFFPAYPLITKGVANLLGAQMVFRLPLDRPPRLAMERLQQFFLGSALLVSLLAFAWGMVWLYRLAREHLDGTVRGLRPDPHGGLSVRGLLQRRLHRITDVAGDSRGPSINVDTNSGSQPPRGGCSPG